LGQGKKGEIRKPPTGKLVAEAQPNHNKNKRRGRNPVNLKREEGKRG